jgi:hypothetical protein
MSEEEEKYFEIRRQTTTGDDKAQLQSKYTHV